MVKFHHFRNFLIKIFLFSIQSLAIEMFKVFNNIAATIINDLFTTYHSYNLCSKSKFAVPSVRTLDKDQNSKQYYCPLSGIWHQVLHKGFWNVIHIPRRNMKMEVHKLPLSPLQKKKTKNKYTKSRLHKSDLIQYFCL